MKKAYIIISGILALLILVFLILGFVYPFSFFNVTHQVSITSDHYVVQEQKKEVNKLHSLQRTAHLNKDTQILIDETNQYLKQKWLLQKHYKFSYNDIASQKQLTKNLIAEVDSYRKQNGRSLSQDANDYLSTFRQYLKGTIHDSNLILDNHMITRNTLKLQIFNLRGSYNNTAYTINMFVKQLNNT
ncbi:hypothetical protein [Sporolactobacillus spathodeae]|uniref:Uncharacterized protein n=1 Tax=Sporolactobacillus spathodeae TaxID=1465502 RepID=A0ABS2Q999_9BACL|nr:hypothetical protein [Sporolactobacillus spathodeae]MBM7657552.1 hypothetical protein [Sporolactobacillus spathodeae]